MKTKRRLKQEVVNWTETAAQYARNAAYWQARAHATEDAVERAKHELGVPQPGYPAPVANAIDILSSVPLVEPLAEKDR